MTKYIQAERGVERMRGETKDCTVRALACAKGISYDEAHAHMKAHGRVDRKGVMPDVCKAIYEAVGFKLIGICGTTNKALWLHGRFPEVKRLPGTSIKKLLPSLSKGRYIVGVYGHVFAVVDGMPLDYGYLPANKYVTEIYKLG